MEWIRGVHIIERPIKADRVPSGDVLISHCKDNINGKIYDTYSVSINTLGTENICSCYNLDVAKLVAEKVLMNRIEFIELFKRIKDGKSGH